MRLGVRAGKGCELLMDSKMQDLGCRYLQFDEVWGFIGKKERQSALTTTRPMAMFGRTARLTRRRS
jgi:hypothetical protein